MFVVNTLVTPPLAQFYSLFFILVSSYMFRHCRHPQLTYSKSSLKHTALRIEFTANKGCILTDDFKETVTSARLHHMLPDDGP